MPIQLAENSVVANRFRLNRLLGRGGMGSVWHATHLGLDIPCAVKFIEGEFAHMAEAQQRFEREAKAAAQLRSPHVVQILDHGVCDGTPYIAMELLDGEDLGKRLTRVGRMDTREVTTIITQVCRALSRAHQLGIVHRDLKPDNIFLVRDDDREIAKVLDFGIAKSNATALDGSNTKTGAMLGTPYYMSPEQAQGIKSVDFRSDLWSLAVIVFQAVTGHLPFESEALGDLLVKIIVQPIPVPSHIAHDVPPGFDAWWNKASQRDPALRHQTAKEFAEALGMVFGLSQLTDVMDRSQLRAVMGGTPNPATQAMPGMMTPSGYGGQAARGSMPSAPGTHGMTPQPQLGIAQPPPNQAATTGGPMARTFGEGGPPVPARKSPIALIAAGVSALVLVGIVAGTLVLTRGHAADTDAANAGKSDRASANATTTTAVTTLPTTDPPPAMAAAVAQPAAPVAPAPAPAASSAAVVTKSVAPSSRPGHGAPHAPVLQTAPAPVAAPATAVAPPKPAPPKPAPPRDLGF
jgi:hypothetical protein